MRYFNLTLTVAEADAYNASFLEEKSLRAEVARTLIRLVSISARVHTELEELKRSQTMSSCGSCMPMRLWSCSTWPARAAEDAGGVGKSAEQNGSGVAAKAIHESVKKLRIHSDAAVKAIAQARS